MSPAGPSGNAFSNLMSTVEGALGQNLPGHSAQQLMSPRRDSQTSHLSAHRDGCRAGAVLLLLYPNEELPTFCLIQRPETMPQHAGQVALPGGASDQDEEDVRTALREAHEEIGVLPSLVTVLGKLTPLFISRSNFCVTPVVGFCPQRPSFCLNQREVDHLIESPLTAIVDQSHKREAHWLVEGQKTLVPYYRISRKKVWGATAMVLSEFEQLLLAEGFPGAV